MCSSFALAPGGSQAIFVVPEFVEHRPSLPSLPHGTLSVSLSVFKCPLHIKTPVMLD